MARLQDEVAPVPPRAGPLALSAWCVVAAFGTYFCLYAFRKPFTAAAYADVTLAGVGYKTVLVTVQVLGYTLSKFLGVKVIAEMTPERRAVSILGLVGVAQAALLLFGIIPVPYNFACLFLNGLALGLVFGLVLGFLEGRRVTEVLTAGLCASFILADGVTKSVGAYLLQARISESWMPFVAGLLFVPPLLFFVWMLTRIPAPSPADRAERSRRVPMTAADRWQFAARHALGLTPLVLAYVLITVLRSIRADFAPEIWKGLGTTGQPAVFAESEVLVALGVLLVCGLGVVIRGNRLAFFVSLGVSGAGLCLVGVALLGQQAGWDDPFAFMVVLGLGLYLPYVSVQTTIFERLLAMTRDRGNIGYPIYLADAFGYLGYVAVMLSKNALPVEGGFLDFFLTASWLIAGASLLLLVLCGLYFAVRPAVTAKVEASPVRA
jgi:Family of unknown function (DUF5690)